MYERVRALVSDLSDAILALDSAQLHGEEAVRLVAEFSRAEKLVAAGRTIATKRVLETRAWYGHGFQNPAQWFAANAGTSVAAAVGAVQTARSLDELPEVRSALVSGEVSQSQASEIVVAAKADPTSTSSLLDAVQRGDTFKQLHDRCLTVVAAAAGDEDVHERARRGRYFKHRFDGTSVLIDARLAPADAAPLIAYADRRGMQLWEKARCSAGRESKAAYMADAVTSLFADGDKAAVRTNIVVNVHCDASAFERGHTIAGESCVIEGIGPVSVGTARTLAMKGSMKMLGHQGEDITRVKHFRKDIPARVRSAIEARDRACVAPGCDVTQGLEIDHIIPREQAGPTSYENLARLCRYHHYLKTHHGYTLSGKAGHWVLSPPGPASKTKRRFNQNE